MELPRRHQGALCARSSRSSVKRRPAGSFHKGLMRLCKGSMGFVVRFHESVSGFNGDALYRILFFLG